MIIQIPWFVMDYFLYSEYFDDHGLDQF
jgi:hypothetical protein